MALAECAWYARVLRDSTGAPSYVIHPLIYLYLQQATNTDISIIFIVFNIFQKSRQTSVTADAYTKGVISLFIVTLGQVAMATR